MKHLKIIGFAVVAAAALMALVGASAASADVICATNTEPCGSKVTLVHGTIEAGTSAGLTDTSGNTFATCTVGTILADITTQGSGINPSGPITKLTWGEANGSGCNTTVDSIPLPNGTFGTLEVRTEGTPTVPELWAKETKVTLNAFGVSCVYGAGTGTTIGRLTTTATTGSTATVDVNAVVNKAEGSFLCPSTARWTGSYVVTSPDALYVKNS